MESDGLDGQDAALPENSDCGRASEERLHCLAEVEAAGEWWPVF
jgi:hypothetical protein